MVNATARAHVAGTEPNPASAADPEAKNNRAPDDESDEEPIKDTQQLSRKEKRKQQKQKVDIESIAQPISPGSGDNSAFAKLSIHSDDSSDELTDEGARLSRKERRRLKKQKKTNETITSTQPIKSSTPPNHPPKPRKTEPSLTPVLTPPNSMSAMTYYPLLVCSIGNPGAQYANTLHSAGHTILNTVRMKGLYHPFKKGMSGQVATPNTTRFRYKVFGGFQKDGTKELAPGEDDFTLWQSTKLMNLSGPSVNSAWREFSAQQKGRGMDGRLVLIHDELEAPLGNVSIKDGSASPRGHNGLKSVQASLGGKTKWWRIGVGIGRPESRDPAVVSKYVLRRMSYQEERAMEKASITVLWALRSIAEGNA